MYFSAPMSPGSAQSLTCCFERLFILPLYINSALSIESISAKINEEPIMPWFSTGGTAPLSTQLTDDGRSEGPYTSFCYKEVGIDRGMGALSNLISPGVLSDK